MEDSSVVSICDVKPITTIDITDNDPSWILAGGRWNDGGVWIDSEIWHDEITATAPVSIIDIDDTKKETIISINQ